MPSTSSPLRTLLAFLVVAAAAPRPAAAQLAPTGDHYGGRASDTGFGPTPTGGYAATVPLNLPRPHGDLPIPFEITYGVRGFGAAGVGWDVPLSFVQRNDYIAHRRPAAFPDAGVRPRETVVLSLLGQRQTMVPKGSDWVAQRGAPDLLMRDDNGTWRVYDGQGRTFSFSQPEILAGTNLWLLDSIKGSGGALLTITYDIESAYLAGAPEPAITIDILRIDYDAHPTTAGCFKHQIDLVYDTPLGTPLSLAIVGERVLAREHKLMRVDVSSFASCTVAATRLRSYTLNYKIDPDTRQAQLASVTQTGRAGTAAATTPMPVAGYGYGTATYTGGGEPVLRYQATQSIALPSGSDTSRIADTEGVGATIFTSPISSATIPEATLQSLTDVTGDGRPDLVFRQNDQLWVAHNTPGGSGTTVFGSVALLNDADFSPTAFEARSSAYERFDGAPSGGHPNVDYVWRQAIDFNGDGRIDIVDASAEPGYWVVYLNTPDSGTSGIKWQRRSLSIKPLYQHFVDRGLPVEGGYLPLSRRFTGHDYNEPRCWQWQNGQWVSWPQGFVEDPQHCPSNSFNPYSGPEETYTEWEVKDLNGDGYPDVVFNSSPVKLVSDGTPTDTPQSLGTTVFAGAEVYRVRLTGAPNRVEAALNVRGLFLDEDSPTSSAQFSAPVELLTASSCGTARWSDYTSGPIESQAVDCDITDVNGDGLADRVDGESVLLGTGIGFQTAQMTLPGPLTRQDSGHPVSCPPNGTAQAFTTTTTAGLRDLTGDGIPDYAAQQSDLSWQVWIGTGAGFAPPIPVSGAFVLSREDENCNGEASVTTGGLFDVDGDGKPETLLVGSGSLAVYALAGGGTPGTPEAGRLVRVDNGYGALTSITWGSAKNDATTAHQVPSPEIVVTSVQTTGTDQLGGTLAATYYAYGGAQLYYDSTADAFLMPGYQRTVAVQAMASPTDLKVNAIAKIVDTYPYVPWNSTMTQNERFGRYLRAGRVSDVNVLLTASGTDPWKLLTVNSATDSRRISGTHYDYDSRTYTEPTPATENDICWEIVYPYDFDQTLAGGGPTSYDVCSTHGFLYPLAVDSWRGSAGPPSTANVETRTSVRSVDDYGRVHSVLHQNDVYRSDDDYCIDVTYPTPTGTAERVLSAPSSAMTWDCTKGSTGAVFAFDQYEYDNLPLGSIGEGFLTGHTIEKHATDTGAVLGTYRDFDVTWDGHGNPSRLVRVREDGTNRVESTAYDPFALVPVRHTVSGTGAPALNLYLTRDTVSLAVLTSQDANGAQRSSSYDGFGRPVLELVRPAGGTLGALASFTYLGFGGGDPLGRRIVYKTVTDPVAPASIATAAGRTHTAYFDELGRERLTQLSLGSDYANETMIFDARTYDALGRIVYEADPYPASQDPSTAYGGTTYYRADGTVAAVIRGAGPQPFTTVPDATTERFPTWFTHSFSNHQESMSVQDADALTASTPQYGVVRAAISSGAGRLLFRSTWQNGVRLEHEAFTQDRVGQLIDFTRYQDPVNAANPVAWTWQYDSLGRVVRMQEPDAAPQTRTFDNFGELVQVQWTPPSPESTSALLRKYDALGRITHAEEQKGGVTDPATVYDYTYDKGTSPWSGVTLSHLVGRMTHASSPTGEVFFSYDGLGNIAARLFTDENAQVYVEQHTYHGDGSDASVELDLPDDNYLPERVDYGYDSAGRPRSMLYSDGTSTQPLYEATTVDPFGRVRSATLGESTYTASYADVGRRLFQNATVSTGSGSRRLAITGYDAIGREVSRSETLPNGGTQTFSYDALGRLASEHLLSLNLVIPRWAFAYDALGNLLSLTDELGTADASLSYSTTDRDRICRIGYGDAGLGGTACNVSYDSFGNVIYEPTRTGARKLGYYVNGAVRAIDDSTGARADFRYDAFGGLQELDLSGPNEQRKDRQYGAFIANRYELSGLNKTSYTSRRFEGPGVSISRRGPDGPWIFSFDEARGTRFTTDGNGAFVQDVSYAPFGETTSTGAAHGTPQYSSELWNGGEQLDPMGLVQVGVRMYDPVIGRFLQRDPLFTPRTAATTNPYAFAFNEPINNGDPTGLDPSCTDDQLCISATYGQPNYLATASVAGLLFGFFDALTGTDHKDVPFLMLTNEQDAFYDSYFKASNDVKETLATDRYLEEVRESTPRMEWTIAAFVLTAPIRGTLSMACDFFACDQEVGRGGLVSDGHGGVRSDDVQPHHVSYFQQALNIGLDVGLGKVMSGDGFAGDPFERSPVGDESFGDDSGGGGGGDCAGGSCDGDATCFTAGTPVATDSGPTPIETVQPGDRVQSLDEASCTKTVDRDSCRVVDLEMDDPYGYPDHLQARLMRSTAWLADNAVVPGGEVPLALDDLGLDGTAHVTGIEACHIDPGDGCLVTGTFTHQNRTVLRLHFAESAATVEPTTLHRFWSEDRGTWVRAGQLAVGERLRTRDGAVTVSAIERLPGEHQVFNFEVGGAHTYLVSDLELYTHNQCAPKHHVMTNKNPTSDASGGPWTPQFEKLAKRAGRSLDDEANTVRVVGHYGPHPEAYHQAVFDFMTDAVDGLRPYTRAYQNAYDRALTALRKECARRGSPLNKLLTGR